MGTNFYLYTRNKGARPLLGNKAELTDEPNFGYLLHVAKTSFGWKPLFEEHEHVHSVADLKLLFDQVPFAQILDEYGRTYTWPEFEKRVIHFGDSENNWRTLANNDMATAQRFQCDPYEYISSDGFRFSKNGFC